MKKILLQLLFTVVYLSASSQGTTVKYLSGTDKDHTAQWDFYCTGGRNSGKWTKIAVPSNWELQGFGTYNYGHDKVKGNEQGLYKHEFFADGWQGKRVFIVFEGSMTDTKVMINGKQAGPVHQGSFYRFKYDITDLLKFNGTNLLEVTVDKTSANASVNDAERRNSDFWVFGGVFRPVYLEVVPQTFIDRVAINAKADGTFRMDVYPKNLNEGETIEAQVQKLNGENFGKAFSIPADNTKDSIELKSDFKDPLLWNAESPNLYRVVVSIKNKQGVIHQLIQKFGFRTVELRVNDGFYVNGVKAIMKGSNRHSFWPETGRTLNHDIHLMDVRLMKEMNMNAVRMSHYPPDRDFLDVCDSLGLYVLDELTGWQAKYDTIVGHKLVKEMVVRDVNHPSIVFWDNGNEGGWNTGLDNDYALYDPQKRTVLHPWAKFNGADNHHYPDYNYILKTVATGKDVFFPTEFMHGLYDGGAGAGLDDFWSAMMKYPHNAGGFIWAFYLGIFR
jgi:beta-galactosidase/beta-glucuronidase